MRWPFSSIFRIVGMTFRCWNTPIWTRTHFTMNWGLSVFLQLWRDVLHQFSYFRLRRTNTTWDVSPQCQQSHVHMKSFNMHYWKVKHDSFVLKYNNWMISTNCGYHGNVNWPLWVAGKVLNWLFYLGEEYFSMYFVMPLLASNLQTIWASTCRHKLFPIYAKQL